jgi:hypothetical protein
MQEALDLINNKPKGYMVSFEWCGDGFLRSDHFPDKHAGEKLIESESQAWELAESFALAMKGKVCNLYVVGHDFRPVENYRVRYIVNR